MIDIEKNAAVLVAGIAIGVAGHGIIGDIWKATPFSAESKLDKARDQLKDVTALAAAEGAARRLRDDEIAKRDQSMVAYGAQAAVDMSATVARWGEQCQAAFKAGVSFGAARATAKSPPPGAPGHEPARDPVVSGRPASGGLRSSFRDDWAAGAFDPARPADASGVPGAGGRAADR